ncbi:MAG: hypothetical protein GWO24_07200, partial [Akkermansiaceae bacterium]|nr:hypothetical protein [Akkermansiaceae bacterium]
LIFTKEQFADPERGLGAGQSGQAEERREEGEEEGVFHEVEPAGTVREDTM